MTATLITALLPFALKILGMYFDKIEGDKDQKKAYLDFIQKMQSKANQPASVKTSYDAQIERLKKQIEAEQQGGSNGTSPMP